MARLSSRRMARRRTCARAAGTGSASTTSPASTTSVRMFFQCRTTLMLMPRPRVPPLLRSASLPPSPIAEGACTYTYVQYCIELHKSSNSRVGFCPAPRNGLGWSSQCAPVYRYSYRTWTGCCKRQGEEGGIEGVDGGREKRKCVFGFTSWLLLLLVQSSSFLYRVCTCMYNTTGKPEHIAGI